MTVIVFDGRYLAADSMSTYVRDGKPLQHHCKTCKTETPRAETDAQKIFLAPEGTFFGDREVMVMATAGAGPLACGMKTLLVAGDMMPRLGMIHEFWKAGRFPHDSSMLLVCKDNYVFKINFNNKELKIQGTDREWPLLLGSGAEAAHMALTLTGCKAYEAVAHSYKVSPHVGGPIKYVDVQAKGDLVIQEYTIPDAEQKPCPTRPKKPGKSR
jgi:hypothetical protein